MGIGTAGLSLDRLLPCDLEGLPSGQQRTQSLGVSLQVIGSHLQVDLSQLRVDSRELQRGENGPRGGFNLLVLEEPFPCPSEAKHGGQVRVLDLVQYLGQAETIQNQENGVLDVIPVGEEVQVCL